MSTRSGDGGDAWICPSCGKSVEHMLDNCWQCGSDRNGRIDSDWVPVVSPITTCSRCGVPLPETSAGMCPSCGATIRKESDTTPPPPVDPQEPGEARRRYWARLWVGSWLLTIIVGLPLGILMDTESESHFWEGIPFAIYLLLILWDLIVPVVFVIKMLPDDR